MYCLFLGTNSINNSKGGDVNNQKVKARETTLWDIEKSLKNGVFNVRKWDL